MAEQPKNPLVLPEILMRVSIFIPLWVKDNHDPNDPKTYFEPKDLLSCCLVSRLWRQEMMPALWHTIDDRTHAHFPEAVLRKYASHIRIISVMNAFQPPQWLLGPSEVMVRIDELDVIWSSNLAVRLIRINPSLQKLVLIGTRGTLNISVMIEALSTLTSLVELRLSFFTVAGPNLLAVLKNMPKLKILHLTHCDGTLADIRIIETVSLPLTHLFLHDKPGSTAFPYSRFLRSCPQLEFLSSSIQYGTYDPGDISVMLREYCPKLRSMTLSTSNKTNLAWILGMIVGASPEVEEFSLGIKYLPSKIAHALVGRSSTLVRLALTIAEHRETDIEQLLTILCGCHKVKVFSCFVEVYCDPFADGIFAKEWAVPLLDRFEFQGIQPMPQEVEAVRQQRLPTGSTWTASRTLRRFNYTGDGPFTFSEAIRNAGEAPLFDVRLLQHMVPRVDIQEVIVNDSRYTRNCNSSSN
ncbi:hypothetical protein BG011_008071 [Mortierella polycephala]|uniref:F-box domain-containing protein n=1 Tax=Mortierella polycephala TaxID=41804 RepID=A0A9P6TXU2_9FUNG|nr:hypothetical protein BG011_008071 [Mortierella polycephala]